MKFEHILVERLGRITIVTINRPESYNALNTKAHNEMAAAFDEFASDTDQWVAIVTGAGEKAFCAGHDLKQQSSGGGLQLPVSGFGGLTSRFDLAKPVIAAVNGVAMGGGFEIALACDIVVAVSHATFALPEPKVGLAALAGGMQRLPIQIGLKRAMGLMLTGRRISAQQALEFGAINEVVASDALSGALAWAEEILACSPMSVRATKEAAMGGLNTPLDKSIASGWESPAVKAMFASRDLVEGPKAFAEKRAPDWKGR